MNAIQLAENRRLPDCLIRIGIRRLLARRLAREQARGSGESLDAFVAELDASPVAVDTDKANEQHYELPVEYFREVLGPHLKYSCGWWEGEGTTLEESEEAMLELTCRRAVLEDGQRILELGCGWGSLTLWMAGRYPSSRILAVSNSSTQRAFILEQARLRGLGNVEVQTADMNRFQTAGRFDRVVSVEMFEHMKNYRLLMERISSWLAPGGKLFVHIFSNRHYAYPYESEGGDDWMARYFFSGGTMPSDDLLLRFQDHLRIERHWRVSGIHYSRTLEAWLKLQDSREQNILPVFETVYGGKAQARLWVQRWRMFYLACSELFRYRQGGEWMVSHYLFRKPD